MHERTRRYWKKPVVLFFIGLLISFLIRRNLNMAGAMFFSDLFFIIAIVFIITGLAELVSNMGLFNSMVFGGKCLYRIFRQRLGTSAELKDEYIEYANTRRKYSGVSLLLIIGLGFLGISVLPILLGKLIL